MADSSFAGFLDGIAEHRKIKEAFELVELQRKEIGALKRKIKFLQNKIKKHDMDVKPYNEVIDGARKYIKATLKKNKVKQ